MWAVVNVSFDPTQRTRCPAHRRSVPVVSMDSFNPYRTRRRGGPLEEERVQGVLHPGQDGHTELDD